MFNNRRRTPTPPPPPPAPERSAADRWNAQDVGFFDPYYENKTIATGGPVTHSGKDTFFRDVHLFVSRIKDIAAVKNAKLVRKNLWTCLRGRALEWWQSFLTDEQKRLVKLGDGVEEWVAALEKRFKKSPAESLNTLSNAKYTFEDARRHRDPVDYALQISKAAKATGVPVFSQLYFMYNGLETEFRRDLTRPTAATTMDSFLKEIEDNKEIWWDLAAARGRSYTSSGSGSGYSANRSANGFRPQGSYNNSRPDTGIRGGSLPPGGSGYSTGYAAAGAQRQPQTQYPTSYQFSSQNRTNTNQSNRPQQAQPPPRPQTAGAAQSYAKGLPQGQQQNQPRQAGFTPTTTSQYPGNAYGLQPKSALTPYYNSQNQQPRQQYNTGYNQNQQQRQPYYNTYGQGQKQPFAARPNPLAQQRAYHGDELDAPELDAPEPEQENNYEDHSHYQPFEEDFTSHEEESAAATDDDGEIRSFFTDAKQPVFSCRRCHEKFASNNKLHYHVRRCKQPVTEAHAYAGSVTGNKPKTIRSSAPADSSAGVGFRSWRYAKILASIAMGLSEDFDEVCIDTGCGSTMIDRQFLASKRPDYAAHVVKTSPMKVNGIGSASLSTSEKIALDLTIPGEADGDAARASFTRYAYIVDDLKAKLLIGNDILGPEDMVPHVGKGKLTIGSCGNFTTPLHVTPREGERVKRAVRSLAVVTIPPHSCAAVPVKYKGGKLPHDRDFMFNPHDVDRLGAEGGVFSHIVDANFCFVQARNTTDKPVSITKSERLGTLVEYEEEGCYLASPEIRHLAAGGWKKKALKLGVAALAAFQGVTSAAASAVGSGNSTVPVPTISTAQTAVPSLPPSLVTPNTGQEYVLPSGTTIYGTPQAAEAIAEVVNAFPSLWQDDGSTVKLPPEEWMPITLQPDAKLPPSKVYPVSQKDREFIDKEFDKLQAQGKLEYTSQPTPYSYPVFVVWRTVHRPDEPPERKGRVVVDIRGLNKATIPDTYPMPLQADVTALVAGCPYISVFDAASFFYQWLVRISDRHKLTVVSHRGQEQFNVAVMGFKNSPAYVQRKIDTILRIYKAFAKAYVDDIVVFSRTLEEHVSHLRQVFQLLDSYGIRLSPKKSYLGYPTVALLGQKVDAFGLTIAADKLAAIANLKYPHTLKDLEIYLGFTGWLRNYIAWYAQKSEPLQRRKTLLLRESPSSKGRQRKVYSARTQLAAATTAELESYRQLQEAFRKATLLVHHDPTRPLYIDVDASKRRGIGVVIYHLKLGADPNNPKRSEIEPIMFLSRMLTPAEERYWPTELEMAGLVWVVRRARHLIEASRHPTIVFTDHAANTGIAKQTTLSSSNTDKLNLRLVRASTYLSQFRLDVRYRPGKKHVIPDALSRLPADRSFLDEGNLDLESYNTSMTDPSMDDQCLAYNGTLVSMSEAFRDQLLAGYAKEKSWTNLIAMLTGLEKRVDREKPSQPIETEASGEDTASEGGTRRPREPRRKKIYTGVQFSLEDGLIYHKGERRRLCIPTSCEEEVFRMTHDDQHHAGRHRCYQAISDVLYVPRLSRKLRRYLEHCPLCQLNQTKRHRPYGELVPITSPPTPFHTIAIDFIVALPGAYDALLTVTDKFSRRILLIVGHTTYGAEDWAPLFLDRLQLADWGLPYAVISDRDPRFMSDFWQAVFARLRTKLLASTAFHPPTNGGSERTNQTVEIALRYLITTYPDIDWVTFLPALQAYLNNAPNAATGLSPNEVVYGFKTREIVSSLAEDAPVSDFADRRDEYRREAADAGDFANAKAKVYHDARHQPLMFKPGDRAYLRLHQGYSLPGHPNRKMSNQRCGPFLVKRRVGRLAYELELPDNWRIHPVISIAQLESYPGPDPYGRPRPDYPDSVKVEGDTEDWKSYEVERVEAKRLRKFGRTTVTQYFVKWVGYGPEFNEWRSISYLDNCLDLVEEFEQRELAKEDRAKQANKPSARRGRKPPATVSRPVDVSIQPPPATAATTSSTTTSTAPQPPASTTSTTPVTTTPVPAKRGRGRPRKTA